MEHHENFDFDLKDNYKKIMISLKEFCLYKLDRDNSNFVRKKFAL